MSTTTTEDRIGFTTVETALRWLRPEREPARVGEALAFGLEVYGEVSPEGVRSVTITTRSPGRPRGFVPAEVSAFLAALRTFDVRLVVIDQAPALMARDGDDEVMAA